MAHHAEPMDIDDESGFDNKENTYQHTNLLPRSPCTEKGYEELDVSELNMKLRYSITPAASPMSKSMSTCLDGRYNTSTDESLNNTIINEYENKLTRSLNSTLNKTEVKQPKVPLQALPTDIMDSSRSTSVLRPLESTEAATDITITVSNENDIDNLSFPSSSSSMAHTPEATTPTKELPKHDGGSPIMRGLKSVLNIFRSSQSPIPPEHEEPKTASSVSTPAEVLESKPQAIASTPIHGNIKETSISRRNSPLKESIVFNDDLEKELQWSDDSTIVFSSEKIPIRKLFFQEKSSKPAITNDNIKNEDANSTVEYMDVSYNDLSIRDQTLNRTANKSNVNEFLESDGEFVDCESTFTHNKVDSNTEELKEVIPKNNQDVTDKVLIDNNTVINEPMLDARSDVINLKDVPEKELLENNAVINETCALDTTKDIINMILDSSQTVVEGDLAKQLDFSTTDIVNQLSDLINEETVASDVAIVENIDSKDSKLSDVLLGCIQNQVASLVDSVIGESNAMAIAEPVCIKNDDLVVTAGTDYNAITTNLESIDTKISSGSVNDDALNKAPPTPYDEKMHSPCDKTNDTIVAYPSPVDVPLPNDDDINEINYILPEAVVNDELQDKTMPVASVSQNALMVQNKSQNKVNICPPSLLTSDVPLPNTTNSIKTNNLPHESMAVVSDPVESATIPKTDLNTNVMGSSKDTELNETTCVSMTKAAAIHNCEIEPDSIETSSPSVTNVPLSMVADLAKTDNSPQEIEVQETDLVQENATEKPAPDMNQIEEKPSKVDLIREGSIIKKEIVSGAVDTLEDLDTLPVNITIPEKEENMKISFVEPTNCKFSEGFSMDITMTDATKVDNIIPIELCQIETNVISELSETKSSEPVDIVTVQNSSQVQLKLSEDCNIQTENTIDEGSHKGIVLGSMSITMKDKDLTGNDTSKSLDVINDHANGSADLNPCGDVEPVLNIVFQKCEKTPSTEILPLEKVENDAKGRDETTEVNEVTGSVVDIVTDFNATTTMNMSTVTPLKNEHDEIVKEKGACSKNETIAVQELPKDTDLTMNLESTQIVENASLREEKPDEEIMVSESNSPFVSMSAEEVFDPDMKKEEFEKVENVFSAESKVPSSPPASPKIVSKGYNLNFDDIDNINPFATKTKIRMSPPPGPSNASLVTENMNKTQVVEPLKSDNNINRRKSMPERKKPLKAKRNFNSSLDSTENTSSKTTLPKKDFMKITPKTESTEESAKCLVSEINQSESNSVASPTQNVNHDKLDFPLTSAQMEKSEQKQPEAVALPGVNDFRDSTKDETTTALNNETKTVDDCAMSEVFKTDTASSSEQSTYFSAGASSTELGESKNVFNLPELDDFNPFATKSKMRQSPPRELGMDDPFATKSKIKSSPDTSIIVSQEDPNCTVTIEHEKESKDATHNVSTCSGSSKASDGQEITVHEVHTEDEDTLEGPFLEDDDGNDGDKITEFTDNKVDMVEFADLNPQQNEEAGEMFIDAEAFEFLMNQNKSDEVAYSGKESLFLKFDPLFARRVTLDGVSAALNEIKRKQSTPKKTPNQVPPKEAEYRSFETVAGPSDLRNTRDVQSKMPIPEKSEDVNLAVSKPMMAVTPAVNPVVTPRKALTPNKSNRLSMTFTSPAMAVIDRLLSLSGNSPSVGLDTTVTHADRTYTEADQALTQLRELLAEKEIHVYNLRCESKELKDRLSTLETKMKTLEAESAERLKKVNDLTENLAEKTKMNRNMAAVVEEYERTIASLISETEQDKKRFAEERNQIIRDRDEQTAHLASMEVSFNDLHSKYEKSKQVIIGYKTNEEAYKKSIQEFEENLSKMHTNYELLKQHATSKLNHANQELEKINKAHEADVLKYNAMIKRKELHITSLEESLAQKTKANEELTAICDELINKVG